MVGNVSIGGTFPIRIQSMLTSDTRDTESCFNEAIELAEAGCELIRVTAQTKVFASYLEELRKKLREAKCDVPLIADIHFKKDAAFEAVKWVDKVRINPGNFADKKKFEKHEYTDQEYQIEVERISEEFTPLVKRCKELGKAIRIGTNHGSLSDRIMNRYGDTPRGMVESAFEFARVARDLGFHDFIFSMKASNPKVMIIAYRLLVQEMDKEDWDYPLHLGVTEAGDGEDGRVKSAIGIGSLLADGIGDTIRVSLTEDSIYEIPIAKELTQLFSEKPSSGVEGYPENFNPFVFSRRKSELATYDNLPMGYGHPPRIVLGKEAKIPEGLDKELKREHILEDLDIFSLDPRSSSACDEANSSSKSLLLTVSDGVDMEVIPAFRLLAKNCDERHRILLKDIFDLSEESANNLLLSASVMGSLLCDGIGDAICIRLPQEQISEIQLAYTIAQASGTRLFKADYVSCPSCGRTLFDLQSTTQNIRKATKHLKGVRIAVMGCIVNGPGEMADADFGYVGGAPGKINLYVEKKPVKFHVPESEAVLELVELIKEHNRWIDP